MKLTIKRLMLCIIIGLLAIPPAVRFYYSRQEAKVRERERELQTWLEAELNRPEAPQEREQNIKQHEKLAAQLVHGDRMEYKTLVSTMEIIPSPDEVRFFEAMVLSRDSTRIAIAGGDGSSQNIYVAPFPPKNINDFKKVAAIPGCVGICAMRWNDFDSNVIGLISREAEKSNRRLVLYTVDTLKKEKREIYVVGSEKIVPGTWAGDELSVAATFCWEQPDKILVFNETTLHRIHDHGKIELVSKVDFMLTECRILSIENDIVNLFGTEFIMENIDRANMEPAYLGPDTIAGFLPYLMRINLQTKEAACESFCDLIEYGAFIRSNGSRLLTNRSGYDDKFRYMVLDKNNKNERMIVEVPRQGYKREILSEITSDGRYAVCMLTLSDSTISIRRNTSYQSATWDAIGLIALPEPR